MKILSAILITVALGVVIPTKLTAAARIYDVSQYGLKSDSKKNASPVVKKIIDKIKSEYKEGDTITLRFPKGIYNFKEDGSTLREYYISNHDQNNPKKVGLAIEDINNFTLEGDGSEFIFHGRMLPISLLRSRNCNLKNFSIDFENPHIAQIKITDNDSINGITFEPAPWVKCRINKDTIFEAYGDGWSANYTIGIAFEEKTKRIVYNTSDLSYTTKGITEITPGKFNVKGWKDARLIPGTVVAMRTWYRPAPGIFLSENVNTQLHSVKVHYAEGMGLLAQLCENITLESFSVSLKGENDPRYFTTQADATHFSGCKGKIVSCNGLYENMMDDAINIHGTYLKVVGRPDNHTLIGRYIHDQSWGFKWGDPGDEVQFLRSSTMEIIDSKNQITEIKPYNRSDINGVREFIIKFKNPIEAQINEQSGFGIENLTWTPEVVFNNNTVRNNRARGALFSTPQKTLIENNLFDHTSGTAILLCGDCNGWYETGACRNIVIRNNKFINALTNMFQFTNAIISIYPEIPDLKSQQQYFHGGGEDAILIEGNIFETFDAPILYAKSVDGLTYRNNKVNKNNEYKTFHWNTCRFLLERVTNAKISE